MSDARVDGLRALVDDLELFSAHCLKIKTKTGELTPFVWNAAQRAVHELLEKQLRETGKVRALVLKYRQGGISTYIAARYYHRTTTQFGQKALITSHEQKSTDSLFGIVKRFHEHNPLPVSTGNTNAKELIFDKLDGGYALATAGTKDVGRGSTAQVAHLSEFAFWQNAHLHLAGLGSTVADLPGTEIVIESTANGMGNAFHQLWQDAVAGRNEWLPIFLPWFMQDEYRAPVQDSLELSADDLSYQAAYDLDLEQMQWRATKLSTYGAGFEWLAQQEFPASAGEAFRTSTSNPLVNPSHVSAAVNSSFKDSHAALVIGCDPAGDGANDPDRTAIVFRRGRMVPRVEYHSGLDTMQIAGKLSKYHAEHRPAAIFVDKIGLGAGVVDRLAELGVPVVGVISGQAADEPDIYENKRAEMWWRMRDWFEDQPCRIPNDAALISDITAPQPKLSSNGRRLLEKKEDMKKRGVRSPDGADALAATFAFTVVAPAADEPGASRYTTSAPTRAGY